MNKSNIYLIESKDSQGLADMFMRFQEYYESPEFKGKVFSVDEFASWYAQKHGAFTYSKDWCGFNIPTSVLKPFREGSFDPLTKEEKALLDFCKNADDSSYIIGASSASGFFDEIVRHELVHGAFYTNSEYRKEVISCIKDYRINDVNRALIDMGYDREVIDDETNAYLLVEPETIENYVTVRNSDKLRLGLTDIFDKYFGFSISESHLSNLINRVEHISV